MSQGQVTFRRIGGRVVPIRSGPVDKQKLGKGATQIATGVVIGGAVTQAGKQVVKKVQKFRQVQRAAFGVAHDMQMSLKFIEDDLARKVVDKAAKTIQRQAATKRFVTKHILTGKNLLVGVGAIATEELVRKGFENIRDSVKGQHKNRKLGA